MLSKSDKNVVISFKQTSFPYIFKNDLSDIILYLEHVDFDLCDKLLKNKTISVNEIQNELELFADFLLKLDVSKYDSETKKYIGLLMNVILIFVNSNLQE